MEKKRLKSKFAEKIVSGAKKRAYQTVGRSWPLGIHEVEIPRRLKKLAEEYEGNK